MSYIVIAIKPSSEDSCCGCTRDQYWDDDEIYKCKDIQELTDVITQIKLKNYNMEPYESGYYLTIVKGKLLIEDDCIDDWDDVESQTVSDIIKNIDENINKKAEEERQVKEKADLKKEEEKIKQKAIEEKELWIKLNAKYLK